MGSGGCSTTSRSRVKLDFSVWEKTSYHIPDTALSFWLLLSAYFAPRSLILLLLHLKNFGAGIPTRHQTANKSGFQLLPILIRDGFGGNPPVLRLSVDCFHTLIQHCLSIPLIPRLI